MQDLNDLAYFAAVADHGGFAAAGRALGIPKSKLSRRVAQLEARLGVRLMQRTTRRFAVTEVGEAFLSHCRTMATEAEAAEALVAEQAVVPRGSVRLSCPPALLQYAVDELLVRFLNAWPQVSIKLQVTNRNVDVWQDGVDFALRVRAPHAGLAAAEEVVRPLALSPHVLVCAPALLGNAAPPASLDDLMRLPTLGLGNSPEETIWTLTSPSGQRASVSHRPRLVADDAGTLLSAALRGVGCAVLPRLMVFDALRAGDLRTVLHGWEPVPGQIQIAYPSRRGMTPALRQLLDALAAGFAELIAQGKCLEVPIDRTRTPAPGRRSASAGQR